MAPTSYQYEPPREVDDATGGGADVLCVDDDDAHLDAVARKVQSLGFSCMTAGNVEEADRLLGQARFRAVILDLVYADRPDGLDLLRQLEERRADITVAVFSGSCEFYEDRFTPRRLQVAWIAKPHEDALADWLRAALTLMARPELASATLDGLRGVEPLYRFEGVVDRVDIDKGEAVVCLKRRGGLRMWRVFPLARLEQAGCGRRGADIEYTIWAVGAYRISHVRDVSPTLEERLARDPVTISEQDLERFGI